MPSLSGSKTYIVAAVMVAYAIVEWWNGAMMQDQAAQMVLNALGLGGLRAGVSKAEKA